MISAPREFAVTPDLGASIHALVAELYPLCRSVAGPGVLQTLEILQQHIPLEIESVPTGTRVFDWTVPREWHIRSAWIKDSHGRTVVDFANSNLHVVNYSVPVHAKMSLAELRPHLHTLPQHPTWVPYRTSYYHETWGFCLSEETLSQMTEPTYEVCIDADHRPGALNYGELVLPGESTDEVLFSCHVCHPSLANDNLSGIAVAAHLAQHLARLPRRYTYRFVFLPATVGAITWLSRHPQARERVKHGLVLTLLGDSGNSTYKRSRRGQAEIDRAVEHVLTHSGQPYSIAEFVPFGYDERQYCSPGFNLPVGCLMRTPHGQFPQYHTSADDLDFVQPEFLADSYHKLLATVELLENNRRYLNLSPCGEPQLGRRGLYQALGGSSDKTHLEQALLWVLNFSDGRNDLLDIAERSEIAFPIVQRAAELLVEHRLLQEAAHA